MRVCDRSVETSQPFDFELRGREAEFALLSAGERLARLRSDIAGRIVFTTSFGLEDQAITHLIAAGDLDVDIVTLDTGRLFPETYRVWAETEDRYGRRIAAVYPDRQSLEFLVREQGIDGFYASIAMRKACCGVRKIEPLNRALLGAAGWIAGLRADQSPDRGAQSMLTLDRDRRLVKLNPIFDWSRRDVETFIAANGAPVNALHAAGYLSIGCAPCTRAVEPGEDERAGRWWWEDEAQKECGLHIGADGRLVRAGKTNGVGGISQ